MSASLLSRTEASREGIVSPSESREVDLEDRELRGGFGPLVTRAAELLLLLLLFLRGGVGERRGGGLLSLNLMFTSSEGSSAIAWNYIQLV